MSESIRQMPLFFLLLVTIVFSGCATSSQFERPDYGLDYYVESAKGQIPPFTIPERDVGTNTLTRSDLVGRWEGSRGEALYVGFSNPDELKMNTRCFTTLTLGDDGSFCTTDEWDGSTYVKISEGEWKFQDGMLSIWSKGVHKDYSILVSNTNRIELVLKDLSTYTPRGGHHSGNERIFYNESGCICTVSQEYVGDENLYTLNVLGPQILERATYKRTVLPVPSQHQQTELNNSQVEIENLTATTPVVPDQTGAIFAQALATQAAQTSQAMSTIKTPIPTRTVVTPQVTTPTPIRSTYHPTTIPKYTIVPRAPSFGLSNGTSSDSGTRYKTGLQRVR